MRYTLPLSLLLLCSGPVMAGFKLGKESESTTLQEINDAKQTIYDVRDGFNSDEARQHFANYLAEETEFDCSIEDCLNDAAKKALPIDETPAREQKDILNNVFDTKKKALRLGSAAQIAGQDQNYQIRHIDDQTRWLNEIAHMIVNLPQLQNHVSQETMQQYKQQARGKIDPDFDTYRQKAETEIGELYNNLYNSIYHNEKPQHNRSSEVLQYYTKQVNKTLQNHPEYVHTYNNQIDRIQQLHTLLGIQAAYNIESKGVAKSSNDTHKSAEKTGISQPSFRKVHVPNLPEQQSSETAPHNPKGASGSIFNLFGSR